MTRGRTLRPVNMDRATVALVLLIEQRVDKPCPTHEEIMAVTGLPQRAVWEFVEEARQRGLIEIEEDGVHPGTSRRMRTFSGQWTDWTKRKLAKLP
jgi:hypothetical protein